MSKIRFSGADISMLRKNKNILKVSEKAITYTDEFKSSFMEEYLTGKLPRDICKQSSKTSNFPPQTIQHFSIE